MKFDRVEDTLDGGYAGLYGEVVTEDCYRIRGLDFQPDYVIDLGANVGVFTRFAREQFPDAKIISIEPDAENFVNLVKFTQPGACHFVNAAIGVGPVYRMPNKINGAHEVYASKCLGFEGIEDKFAIHDVRVIRLREVMKAFDISGKTLLKMDIEGSETTIFDDPKEIDVLRAIDYMAFELHSHLFGPDVKQLYNDALAKLEETHDCQRDEFYFWARKKH